jgi:hypothetical protein
MKIIGRELSVSYECAMDDGSSQKVDDLFGWLFNKAQQFVTTVTGIITTTSGVETTVSGYYPY